MYWFRSQDPPRSARSYVPTSTNHDSEVLMTDLVLSEIQNEIIRFEETREKRRQEALREARTPDYSWLMDWKVKSKKFLNFKESAEIETLCNKIRPCEWKEVILNWRGRITTVEFRDEIINEFRAAVYEVVNSRCRREISLIRETEEATQITEYDIKCQKRHRAFKPHEVV
uniref:Uncharacterized protein n=1 Tax=Acrobeloides nanus TaxID=290746 RepID=A0A914E7M7_9BILA